MHVTFRLILCLGLCLNLVGQETQSSPRAMHSDIVQQKSSEDTQGSYLQKTDYGAKVVCKLQDLVGRVIPSGLVLTSTSDSEGVGSFSIRVDSVGRVGWGQVSLGPGRVVLKGKKARVLRHAVFEEISSSAAGIRQDFVVIQRPKGRGHLELTLEVDGVTVNGSGRNLDLTLPSGRKLAWHGLHVTDDNQRKLSACWSVVDTGKVSITVDDSRAKYPITIDPTFTDVDWFSYGGYPGCDYWVNAMVNYDGGIVIGGRFDAIGSIVGNGLAFWNGSTWSSFGSGVTTESVTMAASGIDLYIGGALSLVDGVAVNNVAHWDGSSWRNMSGGLNDISLDMVQLNGDLYVGGKFTTAGGSSANHVAVWDGTDWSSLGSGITDNVEKLATDGVHIYAATQKAVYQWDGAAWSQLGMSFDNGPIQSMAAYGSKLYVGGYINIGTDVFGMAEWDGVAWNGVTPGPNVNVETMLVHGGELYVGGSFTFIPGCDDALRIAKWDGATWYAFETGIMNPSNFQTAVKCIVVYDGLIIAGGDFGNAGGRMAYDLAKWNGVEWSPLASGLIGRVSAVAVNDGEMVIGGDFTLADGVESIKNLAKWDGSTWVGMGDPPNDKVITCAYYKEHLVVGGMFTSIGGVAVDYIATYDGLSWSSLGTGVDGAVLVVTDLAGTLHVGGAFQNAGGASANRIATWDGASWSSFGVGLDGSVYAIITSETGIYAGGSFDNAGGVPAQYVAHWDGATWSAAVGVLNDSVYALAKVGDRLYVGGAFSRVDGSFCSGFAAWEDGAWIRISGGMRIYSLQAVGSDVFVGGSPRYLQKYDGTSFTNLGSGVNGDVRSLAVFGTELYVTGEFSKAGNKVASLVAQAHIGLPPSIPVDIDPGNNQVQEAAVTDTYVGCTVASFDPDVEPLTYTFLNDAGGRFSIHPQNGGIAVVGSTDYESNQSHDVVVKVTDGFLSQYQTFTINILNVVERVLAVEVYPWVPNVPLLDDIHSPESQVGELFTFPWVDGIDSHGITWPPVGPG